MIKKLSSLFTLTLTGLLMPVLLLAQNEDPLLKEAADTAGYNTGEQANIGTVAGGIVSAFLSIVGLIFISYIIYGGFLWMTAGGNDEHITKAKSIIKNGIIGLIVIFAAAAIYLFVRTVLVNFQA